MISAGTLEVGTRLPTVRELSRRLGVSPTTVSEAWRSLADVGAIETRGRNGTFVRRPTGPGGPRRYRQVTEGPGHFALDLSSGTPDPVLLPDLAPIVARVSRQSLTSSYLDHPVLPALEEELGRRGRSRPRRSPSSTARSTPSTASPAWRCASATGSSSSTRRSRRCSTCSNGSAARWSASTSTTRASTSTSSAPCSTAARRRPCSCSRGPRTRPAWRCRRAGRRRSPTSCEPRDDARRRGRPRQRDLLGAARQRRRLAAGAHGAHPQLLEEPRARPAPRRRRRRRRRSSPPSRTAGCSGRGGRAASCRRCCSS